jgi:elongation factor Ts
MSVTAAQVKELREKSGAGMLDCKKALEENGGNIENAIDWLRTKGLAAAAKKAGRVAAEGLVAVATAGNKGCIIELNAETDFVARNEQFQTLASDIAKTALASGAKDIDALKEATISGGNSSVEASIVNAISTIGENMNLRRVTSLNVDGGIIASYIHNSIAPNLGKIAVLVALKSDADEAALSGVGKQIAMHIAAAKPDALSREDVDAGALEREKVVLKEQAIASGKPAEIAEKMVEGRIRKYYEEVVLLEQIFVIDGKTKVSDFIAEQAKAIGKPIAVTGYASFILGDGIEKEESDFAAEVAATAGAA